MTLTEYWNTIVNGIIIKIIKEALPRVFGNFGLDILIKLINEGNCKISRASLFLFDLITKKEDKAEIQDGFKEYIKSNYSKGK